MVLLRYVSPHEMYMAIQERLAGLTLDSEATAENNVEDRSYNPVDLDQHLEYLTLLSWHTIGKRKANEL